MEILTMVTTPKSAGVNSRARTTVLTNCAPSDRAEADIVAAAPRTASRRNSWPRSPGRKAPLASKGIMPYLSLLEAGLKKTELGIVPQSRRPDDRGTIECGYAHPTSPIVSKNLEWPDSGCAHRHSDFYHAFPTGAQRTEGGSSTVVCACVLSRLSRLGFLSVSQQELAIASRKTTQGRPIIRNAASVRPVITAARNQAILRLFAAGVAAVGCHHISVARQDQGPH